MSKWSIVIVLALLSAPCLAQTAQVKPGEVVPSEDALIPDLHSLGLINGQVNIFRCGCPMEEIVKQNEIATQPVDDLLPQAEVRLARMYELGIRTIISFQAPGSDNEGKAKRLAQEVALEKQACKDVGIDYIARPIGNNGPNSLETMSDEEVLKWLQETSDEIFDAAKTGGVAIHCSAGHDRTGIVCAYLRMKYEHWPVDQAIAEMRRYGHNWIKFSNDGGKTSWHEQHLRAIAKMLEQDQSTAAPAAQ
ncbi:MAG TPA: dual specificity protein phosphatase family protein [Tepidisphaeraceae bacterium]|nr:dual specificity protein phosphatase family protein [Tepidisphaeraceae bacterium]